MLYSDSDSAMWCGGDSGGVGLLFMGGCYKTESQPGSEICTAAKDGLCTTCNTANGLFKNPATAPKSGSECILCWDTVGDGATKGVEGCATCTAPANNKGAATCTKCQDGYYKNAQTCVKCNEACLTCDGSGQNACTSCPEGKYLKTDSKTCVEASACAKGTYADEATRKCESCTAGSGAGGTAGVQECAACAYNKASGKLECSECTGGAKIPRVSLDGTSTCVAKDYAGCAGQDNALFIVEDKSKCLLCDDVETGTDPKDQGVAGCKACTKTSSAKPTCTECLEGYKSTGVGSVTCTPCHANCATCSAETAEDKCLTCKAGFFLVDVTGGKKCVPCDSKTDNGIDGCAECDNSTGSLKCTKCKVNYKQSGTGPVTCTKTCEDETACGGTSGACDAIVIDDKGNTKHYCSYCGDDSKVPIDGKCVDSGSINGNTCAKGVCTQCAQGYFLYMGGCYKVASPPGNLMCTEATTAGVCTEAANNKYFVVPGASNQNQSVLACGNPLGTLVGTQGTAKAYVGVLNCSQCTAPAALSDGGMAAAICTSCDSDRKPNRDGSGCFACAVSGCSHCNRDDMCEACNDGKKVSPGRKSCVDKCPSNSTDTDSVCVCDDGYSPDSSGTSCVSMSTNRSGLSTGAIAGISVAVIAVVGGLIGFLCWWFLCRGKA
eukprot:XP_001707667.1 VSP [Giardia lamblia ATCC 50803]